MAWIIRPRAPDSAWTRVAALSPLRLQALQWVRLHLLRL